MTVVLNIFINQGADFSTVLNIVDSNNLALNLTGHTVLAQIRKTYGSTTSTSFTTAIDSDPSTGKATISLTDTQTTALEEGRYVYDVLITNSSGIKTRAVQGIATVSPSVSRS